MGKILSIIYRSLKEVLFCFLSRQVIIIESIRVPDKQLKVATDGQKYEDTSNR